MGVSDKTKEVCQFAFGAP